MKKIAILTSGGDAPGMNAGIRAICRSAIYHDIEVYGVRNGFQGLIDGEVFKMDITSVADIIHRGGTFLGTSRSSEFKTDEGFKKALNVISVFNFDCIFILGGEGTFKGANALKENGINVICIPCTIDNDLGYTDYTIGFFTALTTVTNAIGNIRDTTEAHGRANVVEVMGRHCGDIALYAGVAGGAENIIIPEKEVPLEEIAEKVIAGKNRGKRHHIIVLAEGTMDPYEAAKKLTEMTGVDTRVTILGYLQRGGEPTVVDRILATAMGKIAVDLFLKGETGVALGYVGNKIRKTELGKAVAVENTFNEKLYEILKLVSI